MAVVECFDADNEYSATAMGADVYGAFLLVKMGVFALALFLCECTGVLGVRSVVLADYDIALTPTTAQCPCAQA